jgi:hypothetical protein
MRDHTKGRSCLAWRPVSPGGQSRPARQLMPPAVGHTMLPAGPRSGKGVLRTAARCIPAWPVWPTEVRTRILQEGLAIGLVIPAVSLRCRLRVRLPDPTLRLTPGLRVARVPSAVTFSLPLQVRSPVRALVLAERFTVGGPEPPVVLSPAPWRLLTYPEQRPTQPSATSHGLRLPTRRAALRSACRARLLLRLAAYDLRLESRCAAATDGTARRR